MKEFQKYDPEDIESLLLHKEFSELYESEKLFVLRHITSEEEYVNMREQLLQIRELMAAEEHNNFFTPQPHRKEKLLAYMKSGQPERVLWLNSLFAFFRDGQGFRAPALQLAFFVLFLLLGITLYTSLSEDKPAETKLAENEIPEIIIPAPKEITPPDPVISAPQKRDEETKPAKVEKPAVKKAEEKIIQKPENRSLPVKEELTTVTDTIKTEVKATQAVVLAESKVNFSMTDSIQLKIPDAGSYAFENPTINNNNDFNVARQYSPPMNSYNLNNQVFTIDKDIRYKSQATKKTGKQRLSRNLADTEMLQQLMVEAF